MSKAIIKNKISPMVILAGIELISVAVLSIVLKVKIISALPLMISAVVMFMQTRVNRYAFLLGSINSLIYVGAYISMKLYGSAFSALLLSFPFQIAAFINWQKNTTKGTTEIKRLSNKARLLLFVSMAAIWVVLFLLFNFLGSAHVVLDNTIAVVGIVSSVLCLLRYAEFSVFQIISSLVNVVLFSIMTKSDTTKVIWLIYSIYCVICCSITFIKTRNGIRREE